MKKYLYVLIGLLIGALFISASYDFYRLPAHAAWSEKFRPFWTGGLGALGLLFAGLVGCVSLAIVRRDLFDRGVKAAIRLRERLGVWRWPLAVSILALPIVLLLYSVAGFIIDGYILRLFVAFMTSMLVAVLITRSATELIRPDLLVFSILAFGSSYVIADYLTFVRTFPFSLSWSEGNRLYDYSVILGSARYLYPGELTIPYDAPGRYLLWGSLFLINGTPIWLHRLWDAGLWVIIPLVFGVAVARWNQLGNLFKAGFALWVFLFLYQGPIYPPLVVSAIIVALLVQKGHPIRSLVGVAIASYYASSSRWTWVPAPAIWTVLILISGLEIQPEKNWKRIFRQLIPIAIIAGIGLSAGFFAKADFFTPEELSSTSTLDQPLLWYRLFPNATYSAGILQGGLLAAGPVIAWMLWAVISRWWRVNWIQAATYALAGLATLVVGLIISVKIGGGNNLHNLDMFFVTIVVLTGIMLQGQKEIPWKTWPILVQLLVGLVFVLPAFGSIRTGSPLRLPDASQTAQYLDVIRTEVEKAKPKGEILFIDQRQLLTFGYLPDVPLVSDYEKKFLMDMAMANNREYFETFHDDLANQRFKLIISDPLRVPKKSSSESFGEENNAWVKWVARPILCYYEPVETLKDIRVQILIPRTTPKNCP